MEFFGEFLTRGMGSSWDAGVACFLDPLDNIILALIMRCNKKKHHSLGWPHNLVNF